MYVHVNITCISGIVHTADTNSATTSWHTPCIATLAFSCQIKKHLYTCKYMYIYVILQLPSSGELKNHYSSVWRGPMLIN